VKVFLEFGLYDVSSSVEMSVILIDVSKDVGSGDLTAFWTHL